MWCRWVCEQLKQQRCVRGESSQPEVSAPEPTLSKIKQRQSSYSGKTLTLLAILHGKLLHRPSGENVHGFFSLEKYGDLKWGAEKRHGIVLHIWSRGHCATESGMISKNDLLRKVSERVSVVFATRGLFCLIFLVGIEDRPALVQFSTTQLGFVR